MGQKCLRRVFTSVSPVVLGHKTTMYKTEQTVHRETQEKRLGVVGEVQCGGTDNTTTRTTQK